MASTSKSKGSAVGGELAAPRLKVVVRRLPANLPAAVFWKSVSPWIIREDEVVEPGTDAAGRERVIWSSFRLGKVRRSGKDKDDVHSRAYVAFKTIEALVTFTKAYDGWTFKDKKGNMSKAVVEFAQYQRIPPAVPAKADARQGTIEEDADYKAFVESLTAPEIAVKVEELVVDKRAPRSTPLLDHLREQKAAELSKRSSSSRTADRSSATASTSRSSRNDKRKEGKSADKPGGLAAEGKSVNGKGKERGKAKSDHAKEKQGKGRSNRNAAGSSSKSSLLPPPLSASAFPALNAPTAVQQPAPPQFTIAIRPNPLPMPASSTRPPLPLPLAQSSNTNNSVQLPLRSLVDKVVLPSRPAISSTAPTISSQPLQLSRSHLRQHQHDQQQQQQHQHQQQHQSISLISLPQPQSTRQQQPKQRQQQQLSSRPAQQQQQQQQHQRQQQQGRSDQQQPDQPAQKPKKSRRPAVPKGDIAGQRRALGAALGALGGGDAPKRAPRGRSGAGGPGGGSAESRPVEANGRGREDNGGGRPRDTKPRAEAEGAV